MSGMSEIESKESVTAFCEFLLMCEFTGGGIFDDVNCWLPQKVHKKQNKTVSKLDDNSSADNTFVNTAFEVVH